MHGLAVLRVLLGYFWDTEQSRAVLGGALRRLQESFRGPILIALLRGECDNQVPEKCVSKREVGEGGKENTQH